MRNWLVSAIAIGVAIVLWDVAVRLADHTLIPGPLAVASALGELAATGRLFKYAIASLFRVTWGFLLAVGVGIPIGSLVAARRARRRAGRAVPATDLAARVDPARDPVVRRRR